MTVTDFINAWNAACIDPACHITAANLFNHKTNGLWGGGAITNVHLYDPTGAAADVVVPRGGVQNVADFFAPGQVIQVALNHPYVTSVYLNPPVNNPTRFTPQVMVFVS